MPTRQAGPYDKLIRHQVFVEGIKEKQANEVAAFLTEFYFHIRTKLFTADSIDSKKKLTLILREIKDQWDILLSDYSSELSIFLEELVTTESKYITRFLNQEFDLNIPIYAPEQLFTAIMHTPWSVRQGSDAGELVGKIIKNWSKDTINRSINLIRLGYVEGLSVLDIVRSVVGTRSLNYKDGLAEVSRRNAKALIRTVVHHLASQTRFKIFEKSSDIEQYQWVATLDSRTTIICQSLDLQKFYFSKGPVPPIHIQCRSAIIPVFKDDIWLSRGRQRASEFGLESAHLSYYEWLKKQTVQFQNDVLGKQRAELFRKPEMTADKFAKLNMNRSFVPRTLEEIKKLEPEYFD